MYYLLTQHSPSSVISQAYELQLFFKISIRLFKLFIYIYLNMCIYSTYIFDVRRILNTHVYSPSSIT